MATIAQPRAKRFSSAVLALLSLLLANLAIPFFAQAAEAQVLLLAFGRPLWAVVAAAALFTAAWQVRTTARRMALAWLTLALAQVSLAVGALLTVWQEGLMGVVGFPSLADGFQLLAYPLLIAALFLLPVQRLTPIEEQKVTLDLTMVLLSALIIFWVGGLGLPAVAISQQPWLVQLVALIYLAEALVLVAAFVVLIFHRTEMLERKVLALLAVGAGALIVANWNYGLQSLLGHYSTGNWFDLGWVISSLLFALVGFWQANSRAHGGNDQATKAPATTLWGFNAWFTYLPYALPLLVFGLVELTPRHDELAKHLWLRWSIGLNLLLMFTRQMVTLRENRRLVVQLRQQALALQQINRQLQIEIGERERAEDQLAYDALHDTLTGLPNRVLFRNRLHQALELAHNQPGQRFAVLFVDLDHFKTVNDSLGHPVGDQLLAAIAQRLKLCVRPGDTVARLSGDEFVILLKSAADRQDVQQLADCLLTRLKTGFLLAGHQLFASASIGIVADAQTYAQPDDVLRDADIAMYYAKLQGKGRYEFFAPTMLQEVLQRIELEHDLHKALERQEFELYYQPIVSLPSERLTGFEALLRWRHPQRGLVSPAEFIPIAEECGLIVPIGQWVLGAACRQLKEWQRRFSQQPPLTMSINVSAKQFAEPGFVQLVEQTLGELALEPNTVRLEITEGAWLNSSAEAVSRFHQLHALGVQFDIDDFGTGYSSLSYLQHFPIQSIKIARTFVEQMDKRNKNREIIRGIIAMAHDLGMEAVAEGVETVDQLDKLKALGCNYGQGYLVSRPVAQAEAEQLLIHSRAALGQLPASLQATQRRPRHRGQEQRVV